MNNKKRGFSLVGLLVLLAIATVAIVLTASVMTRRHMAKDDEPGSETHGTYVCYRDDTGLHEVAIVNGDLSAERNGCNPNANNSFIPKSAKDFKITLIGGGGGGAVSAFPEINYNDEVAYKEFPFPEDQINTNMIDFNLPYVSDKTVERDVNDFYTNFITRIEIKGLRVEGGGGANAVLRGLGGQDVGGLLKKIEDAISQGCAFLGISQCSNLNNIHPSGVNHCRCTNEYDGNINKGPMEGAKYKDAVNEFLGDKTEDFVLAWIKERIKDVADHGVRSSGSESWDWTNYAACSSPQCIHGRGSGEYCEGIGSNGDKTYTVAARGGDGGVCVLSSYIPAVGDVLYYKAGNGGSYTDTMPKKITTGNRFKELVSYSSKGGDGFIRIMRNGSEFGSLIAKGGDAPQYRQVESATWIGANSYGNCPVHASVANCGSATLGDKELGLRAHKCEAKESRGAGKCIPNGLTNSFDFSVAAGTGETKTGESGIVYEKAGKAIKVNGVIYGGGGEGALGYASNSDGTLKGNARTSSATGQPGGKGTVGIKSFVINEMESGAGVPFESSLQMVYSRVNRVKVTLKHGQAGEKGKFYSFSTKKLPSGNIDINNVGQGGAGATDQGFFGGAGGNTCWGNNCALGGKGGEVQTSFLIGNTIDLEDSYDGKNGSEDMITVSTSTYNNLFPNNARTLVQSMNNGGDSNYFGGSGAGIGYRTVGETGHTIMTNTGLRLEYSTNNFPTKGTLESRNFDCYSNTSCVLHQGAVLKTSNRINRTYELTKTSDGGRAGNGGGGAIIITW